jgi:hypothetical protein
MVDVPRLPLTFFRVFQDLGIASCQNHAGLQSGFFKARVD